MLSQARQVIQSFSARPHIFNLSHGVFLKTPPENLEILSQRLLEDTLQPHGILYSY